VNGLSQPDDAFFTPGFRTVITNEEFDDTLTEISLKRRNVVWRYGHAGVPGSAPGYLHAPDDAYRLPGGITTVADIQNCRIVELRHDGSVLRVLGGSCVHDPPRGFASPNGDTPLPDGGLLITEIGGWIDRLDRSGRLVWSVRSPISYPSDAQLLPNGRILVCGFTTPGRVVELNRAGQIVWSFGADSGPDRLDRPSLAIRLPNGLIAINDDWRHRVILVDPASGRIVWQYGHTDVPSSAPGYLDKPDGMDFLPAGPKRQTRSILADPARGRTTARRITLTRAGTLPAPISRAALVALPRDRIALLGGLVGGASSNAVFAGPPERLRRVARLPSPMHDAAAVVLHRQVELFGGGTSVSTPDVTKIDPSTWTVRRLHALDEPLSDLGAVAVADHVYLVGGYTGSRFASAVLRVESGNRTTVVARLPAGLRYAGVTALGGSIYVAGGITLTGPSAAVYRVNLRAGTVERNGTLPRPTAHAPLVAARGALWLIGGDGSPDVLRIEPRNGSVAIAARFPHTLANAAAAALRDGRIVVAGGDASRRVWLLSPTR
jgi:outer membrane protein assembly factor BamB